MTKTNASTRNLTLLTGGTGKTGRRVAERLKDWGVPTRIGSRAADPSFDWNDQSTWTPVLVQPQLVRLGSALWTDTVRPYLSLKIGAVENCYPQKIV